MAKQGQEFDDKGLHTILDFHFGQCNIWVQVYIEKKYKVKLEYELQDTFHYHQIEGKRRLHK